jgi:integrase/recombinase XerD
MAGGGFMSAIKFKSCLSKSMQDFVNFKKMQSFDYRSQSEKLLHFDSFLFESGFSSTALNKEIVEKYITSLSALASNTRRHYISMVKNFSQYMYQFEGDYFLPKDIAKYTYVDIAYVYSKEEIAAILKAAKELKSAKSSTYYTLFGLLYVSGMRIKEALSLNIGDFYPDKNLLFIRKGKFGKDRWIVLADSAVRELCEYLDTRKKYLPFHEDAPMFVNKKRDRLSYDNVWETFSEIIGELFPCKKKTRIHDFRHTFAAGCISKWYREKEDINAMLPVLSTYMGHVNISSTQVYLHNTPELSENAKNIFESYYNDKIKGGQIL